jgi:signal transduction histidine kinase
VWDTLALGPGLELRVQDNMPEFVTERIPLFQVFSNLIGNAVKYHDKPDGWVSVNFIEYPRSYRFFVEDNGPGIDEKYHKKIFIIFQTLAEAGSGSTGVGLAIVKKILDARDEQITVESEPGKGTLFSFTWSK